MLKRFDIAKDLMYLSAAIFFIVAAVATFQLSRGISTLTAKLSETANQVNKAAASVSAYADIQQKNLSSPRTQASIQAAFESGIALKGIANHARFYTLPALDKAIGGLTSTTASLGLLIADTDHSLNAPDVGLLPNVSETARAMGVSATAVSQSVKLLTDTGKIDLDDIHKIMADPSWLNALHHIDATTGNIEKSSQSAPNIAAALEKIANTSSKYQKAIILTEILATIARAFI